MTTLYEAFLPEVLPFVPSCPDVVATNAIRNAVIEFCGLTEAWVYDADPITLVAGVGDYDIDLPTKTDVSDIILATVGTWKIDPRPVDDLTATYSTDWRARAGSPMFYNRTAQDATMTVVPMPDAACAASGAQLKVRVSLIPTRDSTGCGDIIFDNWLEEIAAGAKARLFLMTGQSYYDPKASAMNRQLFNRGVHAATTAQNKSNARGDLRVAFRRNF